MEKKYEMIIRRHEKTGAGQDSDRITVQGFGEAYQKGIDYRLMNPDSIIEVYASSEVQRTMTTAYAWMIGMGVFPGHLRKDEKLFFSLPKEKKQIIRGMTDPMKQYEILFNDPSVQPFVEESGKAFADYVVRELNMPRLPEHSFRNLTIHNGPPINAGYLVLAGKPVNFDSLVGSSGIFCEGQGFDVSLRQDGSLSVVELSVMGKKEEFSLEEITGRSRFKGWNGGSLEFDPRS
jgi:hypothetical protein